MEESHHGYEPLIKYPYSMTELTIGKDGDRPGPNDKQKHYLKLSNQSKLPLVKTKKELRKIVKSGKDEFDIFGESVVTQLRSVKDQYSLALAKFNIQKIIFQAETGAYTTKKGKGAQMPKKRLAGPSINDSLKEERNSEE